LTRDTVASEETLTTPPTSSPTQDQFCDKEERSSPVYRETISSGSKRKEGVPKPRPLTKKEREETIKEQARILAGLSLQNGFKSDAEAGGR
jgi:hypothetical protein